MANTNAKHDENRVTVGLGVSSVDDISTIPIEVDDATNRLMISVSTDSLSPTTATQDKRDGNYVPTLYGVSSVNGVTPIPIRTDENGALLLDIA